MLDDESKYRRLIGRLIYLSVTRPDIVYSVLRYIKGTPRQGLLLPSENNLRLQAYCDSDRGGCRTPDGLFLGFAFSSKIQLFLGSLN